MENTQKPIVDTSAQPVWEAPTLEILAIEPSTKDGGGIGTDGFINRQPVLIACRPLPTFIFVNWVPTPSESRAHL